MNFQHIADFLINECDGVRVKGSPHEVTMDCPECGKGDGHFRFNTIKGMGACFKCDYRVGSIEALVAKVKGISKMRAEIWVETGNPEASRAQAAAVILSRDKKEDRSSKVEDRHIDSPLPKEFIPMYEPLRRPISVVPKVFAKRGYTLNTIANLGLGFCKIGDYAGRIIFPLRCDGKESFFARKIFEYQHPKFKNPPGSKHSQLLYNYDQVYTGASMVFVVEGCTDVCRLFDYGYQVVGTSGKKISSEQIDMLVRKEPKEVVALFDGDAVKENRGAFEKLAYRLKASIAFLPQKGVNVEGEKTYYDPDDAPFDLLKSSIESRVGMSRLDNAINFLKQI